MFQQLHCVDDMVGSIWNSSYSLLWHDFRKKRDHWQGYFYIDISSQRLHIPRQKNRAYAMVHVPNRESSEYAYHDISAFYGYLFKGKDVSVSYHHKSPHVKSHGPASSFASCGISIRNFAIIFYNSAILSSPTTPFQGADSILASYLTA